MLLKKITFSGLCALFLLAGGPAMAQEYAPTPRKMPRAPVAREALADTATKKIVVPTSRAQTGQVTIVDTERLKIGDIEMRLFGVVPPHLSAPFGPQARAALDNLTSAGATNCLIHDRDREGRFFATCRNAAGADLGLELLRRGLAAAARGSLRSSELLPTYLAAEQAAQNGRLGLWSVTPPPAATESAIREAAARNEAAAAAAIAARNEAAAGAAAAAATNAAAAAAAEVPPITAPVPASAVPAPSGAPASPSPSSPEALAPGPDLSRRSFEEAKAEPRVPPSVTPYIVPVEDAAAAPQTIEDMGFVERYQLLVTGILMLLTTMGVVVAVMGQRWWDKREELRSIAAALRGELMAARAVCQARLGVMDSDEDDKNTGWPRIRTLVFQAYVGRLGYLGAILARQIASIYGQASDYASYYNTKTGDGRFEPVSKKQALQTLVNHIEEVLPPLARIELGRMRVKSEKTVALTARAEEIPALPAGAKIKVLADQATEAEKKAEKEKKGTPVVTIAAAIKPVRMWDSIRRFVTHRRGEEKEKPAASKESLLDYVILSEDEEREAMAYGGSLDEEAKKLAKEKKKKPKSKSA